ncbi:MAG: SRPBCC family protein [Candidatus Kapaibacterium sp.]
MPTTKTWTSRVPQNIDKVWDFFSRPENLNEITPDDMKFHFLTDTKGKKMYEGMIIRYKVSPLPLMKFNWVTEITKISEKEYFVDEQRIGPYRMWHHEHHFRIIDENTTEMTDILTYDVGKGILGPILDKLFIGKKVDSIFDFREEMISKYFK